MNNPPVSNSHALAETVALLRSEQLPSGAAIMREGQELATQVTIGRSRFLQQVDAASEEQYKRRCIADGTIMYHAHIGMGSWSATAQALTQLESVAAQQGYVMDRAGICLDRRMALPAHLRDSVPAETGPLLSTDDQWGQVGQAAAIQPHMGDFMIGFPAATANTVQALQAGVTTIGNLSQFFAHEAPGWSDHVTTTIETVRAIALLGAMRERGVLCHSYLEDGYGALFRDYATVAGWAYLERYLVEDLMGAKIAHCFGGLTSDPVKRAGWVFALHQIHRGDCIGSMYYGDTISHTYDFEQNRALVGEYLLWDIMAQIECPTGHAVHPLPVTESLRIPSAAEIAEIQTFGRRVEQSARRMHPYVDFGPAYQFSETILDAGIRVFANAMDGLREAGIDTADPVQMLYCLKKMGPELFEQLFGVSGAAQAPDESVNYNGNSADDAVTVQSVSSDISASGNDNTVTSAVAHCEERLVAPTDIYALSLAAIAGYSDLFSDSKLKALLNGKRLLLASTDVHAHAIFVLHNLLAVAGADVVNLGAEKNPEEVAAAAIDNYSDAILLSTHNGMALDYAKQLLAAQRALAVGSSLEGADELASLSPKLCPVMMGGVLNQKFEDEVLPRAIGEELRLLGVHTHSQLGRGLMLLLEGEGVDLLGGSDRE